MKRWTRLSGILAALATAGVAAAQEGGGGQVGGDFDTPMNTRSSTPARVKTSSTGKSIITLNQVQDGRTFELRIEDGEIVAAKIDGKDVPKDRIRRKDGRVELLDADGKVIQSFHFGVTGEGGGTFWVQPGSPWWQMPDLEALGGEHTPFLFTPSVGEAPPKVMLGINMSPLDEEKARKAGVEEGEGIYVDRVIEELPAAQAGLRQGDIIVRIAGQSPATQEKLREALKSRNPGDKLKLTVLRDGEEKTLTIVLAPYDPEKLGITAIRVEPQNEFKPGEWNEQARKAYEEAMKAYREAMKNFPGEWRFQGQQAPPGMMFRTFPGPGLGADRLSALNDRLGEIERRLGELDARLERLTRKLEKLGEDRP